MAQQERANPLVQAVAYGCLMAAACFGTMAYNAATAPNQMYVAPTLAGQATNVPAAYFQGYSRPNTQVSATQAPVREIQRPLSMDTLSSRVDRPIWIPQGVKVTRTATGVVVEGPKGKMERDLPKEVSFLEENSILLVTYDPSVRNSKAFFGLYRALVANMVKGTSEGFEKNMEMIGVGYRARVDGKSLVLNVGKSHDVILPIPDGLTVTVEANTKIKVQGMNNEVIGQFCANVRKERPPEPYKGKGIRFAGEVVPLKQGKK
uniref:Large ribosomal subunit protein uL6 alpha-beta domain-containing protein n=1 Tax=Eutreptiella gymnastica TaxID=73025 RepID=A0A6U8JGY7_9EUGL